MKSALISIRPQWVEKIASGEKTIEVRRTRPKLEVPFKAYIYETKGQYIKFIHGAHTKYGYGCGKVIGEFVCDKVEKLEEHIEQGGLYYILSDTFNEQAQLDNWELHDYGKGKTLYGWHISELKIYDKPKEVSEFYIRKFDNNDYCSGCIHHETPITEYPCNDCRRDAFERKYLTRPPQSWQYIEDLGEEE